MPARVRVALRDLVNLLSTVGLDVVEGAGDVDVEQLLATLPSASKTSPDAIRLGRAVPAVETPPGLTQAGLLLPAELWPDLVRALVEALDTRANGRLSIRLQLWEGRACHPVIARLYRTRRARRERSKAPA